MFAMEPFLRPQMSSKSNGESSNLVNSGSNVNKKSDNSGTASPDSTTTGNHPPGAPTRGTTSTSNNIFNNKNLFSVHGAATITELAELASSEISLDLQGLIDDTHFGDVNLFGDGDGTGGGLGNGYGSNSLPNRTSPANSLGSSGQSSPGDSSGQDSPPNFQQNYRTNNGGVGAALAYLPGSVHSGATFSQVPQVNHQNQQQQQQQHHSQQPPQQHSSSIQVKQEPNDEFHGGIHRMRVNNMNNNNQRYSNGTVSSTTNNNNHLNNTMATNAMTAMAAAAYAMNNGSVVPNNHHSQIQNPISSSLPSLKSFANTPKYLQQNQQNNSGGLKKKVERNSDEYRRRRERNNVAVRKSREKAKVRTKETEGRVKILAGENERLQKKVELLQEELSVLRSLFSNVGVLPDHIHRELSRQMDNFQQQHNAMGAM